MENKIYNISTEMIIPNANQPRKVFDNEAIEDLANSIAQYGIIQPLTVRKHAEDKYELVAGERRLRAAIFIGLEEVPVIVSGMDEKDSAVVALIENIQRENLNFIEEAEALQNLMAEYEYTQGKVAEVVGKKQSTVANKLRILKLESEVRTRLLENALTERHGRALLKLPTLELRTQILDKVIEDGLNVKKTEQLIEKTLKNEETKDIAADGKKKIKGSFNARVYMNTIKQTFDKFGIDAKYKTKEKEDTVTITVTIPKGK